MGYKIILSANRNAVYASGFRDIARALLWIDNYDPRIWMDKTIQFRTTQCMSASLGTGVFVFQSF